MEKYNDFYVVFKMQSGATYEGSVETQDYMTRDEFFLEIKKLMDKDHTIVLGHNTALRLGTVESFQVKIIMDAEEKEGI